MIITLEIDQQADAAYVRLADTQVARTKELDDQRIVDIDRNGEIVGIEFLAVTQGVDLRDLPHRPELERLFDDHQIKTFV